MVIEPDVGKRPLAKLAYRVRLAGRHDVIVRRILLEHQVHGPHIVGGVAPIALGLEITQPQFGRETGLIRATVEVILRVTNSCPRRGLS